MSAHAERDSQNSRSSPHRVLRHCEPAVHSAVRALDATMASEVNVIVNERTVHSTHRSTACGRPVTRSVRIGEAPPPMSALVSTDTSVTTSRACVAHVPLAVRHGAFRSANDAAPTTLAIRQASRSATPSGSPGSSERTAAARPA